MSEIEPTPEAIEKAWAEGIKDIQHDYTPDCDCRMCLPLEPPCCPSCSENNG